jgi:catechol 2,3-dioxygenase-like lactoylglutathione lyase family enzyme
MSYPFSVNAHHTGIFCSNLDQTVTWWEEMFGFKKTFENVFFLPDYGNARMTWMKSPNGFYIELYDFPGLEPFNREHYWHEYGTKHVSLAVKDDEFDDLIKYLESKNAKITIRAQHTPEKLGRPTPYKVIFVDDPDGNTVEVQQTYTPGEY